MSGFIPVAEFGDPQNAELSLTVNDQLRQQNNTRDMITPILPLIRLYEPFLHAARRRHYSDRHAAGRVGPMASRRYAENQPERQNAQHPGDLISPCRRRCRRAKLLHLVAKMSI